MSEDLKALIDAHVDADEAVEICRELVRVPSENPPGDERAIAETTAGLLSGLGLPARFVEPLPGRVSTLSTWGGGPGPSLLFNGHYDVVPVPDPSAWPHPPFAAVVTDGRIYGRGTTDMKSGIAACLAAVSALQRAGVSPAGTLHLHFVADEEALGTHGTQYLVDAGHCDGIDEAIVGEPTSLNLVTAERGGLWFRVRTEGVAAHGAAPQLGVNAIEHMARIVPALAGIRYRKLHEMLGAPTLNVGTITGGTKSNMVPDFCEIEVDRRTLPGETQEEILAEIEAALDGVRAEVADLRARVEVFGWGEASETPPGMRVVELLTEASQRFGFESYELGYMGMTDARFMINQASVPAVIFGPGDIGLAHTVGEYVEVDELVRATRAYAYAFARFLNAT